MFFSKHSVDFSCNPIRYFMKAVARIIVPGTGTSVLQNSILVLHPLRNDNQDTKSTYVSAEIMMGTGTPNSSFTTAII